MPENPYNADDLLSQYLLLHYGEKDDILPYNFGPVEALEFPLRCVSECLDASILAPTSRALDLGCAVGRSSFELGKHCQEVVGIDFFNAIYRNGTILSRRRIL